MTTPFLGLCVACLAAITLGHRTAFAPHHLVLDELVFHCIHAKHHLILGFFRMSPSYMVGIPS